LQTYKNKNPNHNYPGTPIIIVNDMLLRGYYNKKTIVSAICSSLENDTIC